MGRFFGRVLSAAAITLVATGATAFDIGQHYQSASGWEVHQSDLYGCKALSPRGADLLVIMSLVPAANFELVLPTDKPDEADVHVVIQIDGRIFEDTFFVFEGNAHGPFDTPLREAMAAGNNMFVSIDNSRRLFQPLAGSTAALQTLEACWYDLIKPDPGTNKVLPVALPSKGGPVGAVASGTAALTSCLPQKGMGSPNAQEPGDITFENRAKIPVTLYWVDQTGAGKEMAFLQPGESVFVQSRASHLFYAVDALGACHGPMVEVPAGNSTHVIE
ncbi:hypothetical protein [Chachezhania antarctica]|uniref:hypothetical protein n=1 Tax=Chachezhania antarctica TaxID=2340860 RepID=UPI000EB5416B|nr:hypothetical protein [Chachezhania antarctica]|tara:strand:+ start:219 stop:1043 length:825 start_codon:yes stop_codon:yes gene_type:complete